MNANEYTKREKTEVYIGIHKYMYIDNRPIS